MRNRSPFLIVLGSVVAAMTLLIVGAASAAITTTAVRPASAPTAYAYNSVHASTTSVGNVGSRTPAADDALVGLELAAGVASRFAVATEEPSGSLLRHYTDEDGAAGIETKGRINPSPDGNTYLTPDQYPDGASAQAGLDLDRTPTGYFEFPAPPGAPEPAPVAGGTGTEVPVPGPVKLPPGTQFNRF